MKKTIAILGSRGIPAQYGGFETFAEELSVGLNELGYDVTVYCEGAKGQNQPNNYKGIELAYIYTSLKGPAATIVSDIKALWKSRHTDIVYMLGYGAALFAWLPRLFGKIVWINMDGLEWARKKWDYFPARQWFRLNEFMATLCANRLIADAHGIADYLRGTYRRLPPIDVIEYGATALSSLPDESLLGQYELERGKYDLVVCRLEPENHVKEILDAYKNNIDVPLIVVGGIDKQTSYVKSLLNECGTNIRLIGAIYRKEVLAALRFYCRNYVHGHSVGGTNPSLLEAMAMGNIVLAHDNAFNREVLGDAGFYFRDSSTLSILLDKVEITNSASRKKLSDLVISRITNHYNWPRIIRLYANLISGL